MKTLYVSDIENGKCITHDGYIQLGIHPHDSARHIELCDKVADDNNFERIKWIVCYWIPDVFKNRYKRVNFQKTAACNEGSPRTDNQGKGCSSLQPESRLDRSV